MPLAKDGFRAAGGGVHGAEAFAELIFGESEGDLGEDGAEDFFKVGVAGEDGEIAAGDVVDGIGTALAGNDDFTLVGEDNLDFKGGIDFAGYVMPGADDAAGLGKESIAA